MNKLPIFLSKFAPWILGLILIIGIPYAYLRLTDRTIWDLLYTSEFTISDGNVVKKYSNDKEIILADKEDFSDDGIKLFSAVSVSPDKEKMCFLGNTIAPIWAYWSEIDGSNPISVGVAENCVWSNSNDKIAYTNHTTDVSPHNVHIYDLELDESENMTISVHSLDLMRIYTAPEWADDDSFLISDYIEYDMDNDMDETDGTTKITVASGELEEIEP